MEEGKRGGRRERGQSYLNHRGENIYHSESIILFRWIYIDLTILWKYLPLYSRALRGLILCGRVNQREERYRG